MLQLNSHVKRILNIVGWSLVGVFFIIAWRRVIISQYDLRTLFQMVNWRTFLAAVLVLSVGQTIRSQVVFASHKHLSYHITRLQAFQIWFLSQASKYIPGGIWQFAARVILDRRNNMPPQLATAAMIWENIAVVLTGFVFSLIASISLHQTRWTWAMTGSIGLLIVGMFISQAHWPWQLLVRLRLTFARSMLDLLTELGAKRYSLLGWLSSYTIVSWLFIGAGFYLMLRSVDNIQPLSIWLAAAKFALAWTAGYLTLIAPVGLGPREAVLTVLLTPEFGEEQALIIALLARLWWTAGEGVDIVSAAISYGIAPLSATTRSNKEQDARTSCQRVEGDSGLKPTA